MEYIERDEAIRTAIDTCVKIIGHGITQVEAVEIADAFEAIPAADVTETKYTYKVLDLGHRHFCPTCGTAAYMENYCSNCGAVVKGTAE